MYKVFSFFLYAFLLNFLVVHSLIALPGFILLFLTQNERESLHLFCVILYLIFWNDYKFKRYFYAINQMSFEVSTFLAFSCSSLFLSLSVCLFFSLFLFLSFTLFQVTFLCKIFKRTKEKAFYFKL